MSQCFVDSFTHVKDSTFVIMKFYCICCCAAGFTAKWEAVKGNVVYRRQFKLSTGEFCPYEESYVYTYGRLFILTC